MHGNGLAGKKPQRSPGEIDIQGPAEGSRRCDPQLIKKEQWRITAMTEQIMRFYATGTSMRDIVDAFTAPGGLKIAAGPVPQVVNSVLEQLVE